MAQQPITFEWVLEDDRVELWHGLSDAADRGLGAAETRLTRRIERGIALLMAMLIMSAGAGLSPAERQRRIAERGINLALYTENSAWRMRDYSLYADLIDPTLDERWVAEWRDHWRSGSESGAGYTAKLIDVRADTGLMQTTILVEQPSLPWSETSPYRETRFYRRADQQWLRTMPSAEYWGEPYAIRTAHLRFTYFARDAALVEATADELEQAYIGMYKTLGMEPPSPGEPLTVAVVPEPVGRWSSSIDRLEVTSPVLGQVPEGQSYSDYLAYEVMGWFTYRALRDAAPGTSSRYLYRWPVVVWGLRGWLRDELLTHRSPWRDDLTEVVRARRTAFLPVRLGDISDLRANNDPTREEVILRYVAAESFVRYVAETYGRERLPDLLDALVKHGRWNEIVPEVFGVSARRLETDWNLFLIEEYDLE